MTRIESRRQVEAMKHLKSSRVSATQRRGLKGMMVKDRTDVKGSGEPSRLRGSARRIEFMTLSIHLVSSASIGAEFPWPRKSRYPPPGQQRRWAFHLRPPTPDPCGRAAPF